MQQKLLLFLILITNGILFSQEKGRKELVGTIVSDSVEVQNITVFNKNTRKGVVTNIEGKFSIETKAKDTLIFQALSFVTQHYIVKESDFLLQNFTLKMETKNTLLDEVVITNKNLTGIIEIDSKNIKTYAININDIDFSKLSPDDIRDTKVNAFANNGLSPLTGINFGAILKLFVSKEAKERNRKKRLQSYKNEKWEKQLLTESFQTHLYKRYSDTFFTTNLKIPQDEITAFIAYAEPDFEKMTHLLKTENDFELLEYLIEKSKLYLVAKKEEK